MKLSVTRLAHIQGCVCVRTLCQVDVMSEICHALFIPPFQIEPSLVVSIPFQRPERGRDIGEKPSRPMKVMRSKPHSIAMEDIFLRELQQISPSSVVFSFLAPLSRATPPVPVIRKLPSPLTALQKQAYTNNLCHIVSKMQHVKMYSRASF